MSNIEHSRESRISNAFFVLGSQYYAIARYSALELLMPLCGTLYHHAIEMLLKGVLSKSMQTSELKSIGHNLVDLWKAVKDLTDIDDLVSFDHAISKLDSFERIRYPDSIVDDGMRIGVSFGGIGPSLVDRYPGNGPIYKINGTKLDSLIETIFEIASINPVLYLSDLPDKIKKIIPLNLLDNDIMDRLSPNST